MLTAESVTATTATLKLENHTGGWWFKRTAPDAGSCTAGEADFTNDLTGLIPGTEYTYKAYDVDTCGDTHESASVDFTTEGVSVSNLVDGSNAGTCLVGIESGAARKCATWFETGNATNGYTLHSVTAPFGLMAGNPSGFTVALHAASGSKPASTAISNATFGGSAPAQNVTRTYTCSGSGCNLSANTTYWIVMSTPDTSGTHIYSWRLKIQDRETQIPSRNGWSFGDYIRIGSNFDNTATGVGAMKIAATVNSD